METKSFNRREVLKLAGKAGAGAGLVTLISSILGCESDSPKEVPRTIELKVGEEVFDYAICYNGMNNEKTFSLSNGRDYCTVNNFYPKDINEFTFEGKRFKLEEVTPEKIRLTYLGKAKK